MANEKVVSIERIIAKIDNDFNPDNSDWIPRVAAWAIDAMNQLKCLRKVPKCHRLEVNHRLALSPCCLNYDEMRVYDPNGCLIPRAGDPRCGLNKCGNGGCSPVEDIHNHEHHHHGHHCHTCEPYPHVHVDDCGFETEHHHHDCCHVSESHTREVVNTHLFPDKTLTWTEHTGSYDYRCMHRVHHTHIPNDQLPNRNYVISGNYIELNFNVPYIVIARLDVDTEYSNYYHCEVPKIPDNGLLIEAITNWCMYKMLTRGYKHPVMTLTAASEALNPFVAWKVNIEKVRRSVQLDVQQPINDDLFKSAFMIFTFGRRNK